jgi:plastocyanin
MTFPRSRTFLLAVGTAALWLLAANGLSQAGSSDPSQVAIQDFMFSPNALTVKAGSTVAWVNKDDEPHSVVSDSGLFRSGALDTNESFSFKFSTPGTYHFTCAIHPRMVGTIVVQ